MINNKAPYFSAKAFHKDKFTDVNLLDYQNKWIILFFYPRDFNFQCLNELKEIVLNYEELKKMDVELLSISTDTEFTHKAWHESSELLHSIKFPMIADHSGAISKAYGTYVEKDGVSTRAIFIIDPKGIIRAYEINSELLGTNIKEVIRKVNALKFSKEKMQEFCPI
jgi:alkyl hydroperoxide reductase subunit AhpC